MQFISWKALHAALLVFAPPLNAESRPDHPSVITAMNPRATYLAKGPEVNGHSAIQLRAAARLTLSTPHSCGSNEVYLTPESIGVPDESFRRALGEVQDLIDQKIPLLLTLSNCERKRAFLEKVRPCTPEECGELTATLVDGKLFLDEDYKPTGKSLAAYYLEMPMPYDSKRQAWRAKVFYVNSRALRYDYFVNAEDFASSRPVFEAKAYYPNGQLHHLYQNDGDGLRQGESLTYSQDGVIIQRQNHLNNELDGWQTTYHDNGNIAESFKWHQGTLEDGEYLEYDENQRVIGRTSYKAGVWDGPALAYYPNGKLRSRTFFVRGKAQGFSPIYFENGALQLSRNLLNGKPDGWVVEYFPNGKTKRKESHQRGTQRSYALWNEQGTQTIEWQWDEYKREQGDFKQWHENGQLKEHKIYKDGQLQSHVKNWAKNGQLRSSIHYRDNKRHGTSQYWTDDGKLVEDCKYTDGVREQECQRGQRPSPTN
ncbi:MULTISPECIES: toxin-antitoxin system YwqK family antitoxin [Pseudomonas]|uniref:Toxin-antitoxin system YwqK family antitoxin n=1 Tax=Pseudomonas brassicacearum TaxID=930166 RepID=A0AAJ3KYR2_9PSED|nr:MULTISPECIES: toxin-antitoxin system YwqK family antitoxin [Pseudomonas]NUT84541.1 toxin-antitoxin system YwqK family antitoxin [Pseudomonas brassicacearum]